MSDYVDNIVELNREEVAEQTKKKLEQGEDPETLVEELREGAIAVGERFDNDDYFLADLMRMGDILEDVMEIIEPHLEADVEAEGKVVIGTVDGDIHNIGKDLVASLLKANGFEVVDLGVDVPKSRFIEAIESEQPDVVGMSGLLTEAQDSMKETVAKIENSAQPEDLKIIIGGGTIMDSSVQEYVGADAYATDVNEGINQIREWTEVKA